MNFRTLTQIFFNDLWQWVPKQLIIANTSRKSQIRITALSSGYTTERFHISFKNKLCRQKFSCVKTVKLSIITEITHSSRWYSCLIVSKVVSNKPGSGGIRICYWDPECIFTHSVQKFLVFNCSILFLHWQDTHLVNILSTKHYLDSVVWGKVDPDCLKFDAVHLWD